MPRDVTISVYQFSELAKNIQEEIIESKSECYDLFDKNKANEIVSDYCDELREFGIDVDDDSFGYVLTNNIDAYGIFTGKISKAKMNPEVDDDPDLLDCDNKWMLGIKGELDDLFDEDYDIEVFYRDGFNRKIMDVKYKGVENISITPDDSVKLLEESFLDDDPEALRYAKIINIVRRIGRMINNKVNNYYDESESEESWVKAMTSGVYSGVEYHADGRVFDD